MEEKNSWYSQQITEAKDMCLTLKNGAKPRFPKAETFVHCVALLRASYSCWKKYEYDTLISAG